MAAQTTPILQEAAIRAIIAAFPAPEGVRLRRISFDFDHAGEPAIRVVFSVSQKLGLGKDRISKLGYFRRAVRDAILEEDSGSFPYVTFEDAR